MRNSDKRELKKRYARIGIFLLIVLIPTLVLDVVFVCIGVQMWLNILITVLLLFVLFALFTYVCEKLDNRKEKRLQKKKDPFSE